MTSNAERSAAVYALCRRLGERTDAARTQIRRIVGRCGVAQATIWLEQAEAIEAGGGEMLPDGSRRRTVGGVFFRLVREGVSPEDRRAIFPYHKAKKKKAASTAASQPAPVVLVPVAVTWADRGQLISEAQQQPGKATTVKITIIGRPSKTVERQGFTLLVMEHEGKLAALPKGIPLPPQPLPTSYIIYIGGKQWAKVKDALMNPEDVLIAEGVPVLDPKYVAITMFVTNVTTKQMQRAQRQAQQTASSVSTS